MAGVTTWSEEEDDFLKRAAGNRHSASEIAQLLNEVFDTSRSRSAVCGRASRLGVELNSDLALRGVARRSKQERAAGADDVVLRKGSSAQVAQRAAGVRVLQASQTAALAKGRAEKAVPESTAVPALKPPAKQRHNSHNIRVKATRHLDERFDAIRTQRLAEVAAFEAKLAESGGVNPGVLFMERDITKHCAAPMPGWDAAPIMEKRVCGAPVEWRSVQVGEAGFSMEPTSWCTDCRKRFVVSATDRRADLSKLASVDKSVRRAA